MTRREHARLLTGSAAFVDDVSRPGQLSLAVVRSPVAHGKLRRVDVSEALRVDGVRAALTAEHLDRVPRIPIRVLPTQRTAERSQPVIAFDRVRFVGEPMAVIVADDPYVAEDAAELVTAEIDELAPALTATDDDPLLWDPPVDDNVVAEFHGTNGDAGAAFAEADHVVEAVLGVQRHTGVPMETRGLLAEWRGDELHLWGVTKYITFTRSTVAGFFGLEPHRVVCHKVDVGGMFGVRGEVYPEDFLVPWAARVVGQPVKWTEDRREHLLVINHSREQRQRVRIAASSDGRLLALEGNGVIDTGAYARPIGGRLTQIAVDTLSGPYHWQALDVRARSMTTNKAPVGTMRGPVSYETTFVRERLLDIVAGSIGMDPVDFRRRNLIPPGDLPFELDLGPGMEEHPLFDAGDYPATFEEILSKSDLEGLRQEAARRRSAGQLVGVGIACYLDHSGLGVEETVGLSLEPDGRLVLGTTAAEIGQGLATMATRVLAGATGIDPSAIEVLSGDSRAHEGGRGTFASRSTIFVGNAANEAGIRLREQAIRRAAELLGTAPDAVTVTPEGFRHGDDVVHWKDAAPLEVTGRHHCERPTQGFGAAVALVDIDRGTGGVTVERLIVGFDCGRLIDPESAHDQMVGAAVMGLGGALLEELSYDTEGQPRVTTFIDYLVPTCAEVPAVDVVLVESGTVTLNPLGLRGVGEAGILGVGAAVANACADALGTVAEPVLTHLPLSPASIAEVLDSTDPAASSHHATNSER